MKQLFPIISILFAMATNAQQTNYHFSHTDSASATSDKIWEVWTDVPNWKRWDRGLKEAILDGEFIVGTKGKLIPDNPTLSKPKSPLVG